MTLQDLHTYVTAIYRCGWQDAIEGRKFDPLSDKDSVDQILRYFEPTHYEVKSTPEIEELSRQPMYPGKIAPGGD